MASIVIESEVGPELDKEDLPSDEDDLSDDEIIEIARERLSLAEEAESDIRRLALDDLQFIAGEQWDDNIKQDRERDGRPCLTINRLPTIINQVTNDQRQNRPAIKVHPVGDGADVETAKIIQGMIRHIEYCSNAEEAYDTAFESAARGSFGYFRLTTDFESPESFNQDIQFKRIRNPFSVFYDPYAEEPDGSDAQWCFVVNDISQREYKELYPNSKLGSAETDWSAVGNDQPGWIKGDSARVAEYFFVTKRETILHLLETGEVVEDQDLAVKQAQISSAGLNPGIVKSRISKIPVINWYKINGIEILEKTTWPGKFIPIIPVYGSELFVNGKRILESVIRNAKDPQKMYNYWKPLSLDTPVPTPKGWTTIGDVKTGDVLFDDKGKPCKVLGTSQVYHGRDCYKILFDDGSHIVADGEHSWTVEERGIRKTESYEWSLKTISTKEMIPGKHFIYNTAPLETSSKELPVDPYFLGVWLGDGSKDEPRITAGQYDVDHMRAALFKRGLNVGEKRADSGSSFVFTVHDVRADLNRIEVLGNKHIPKIYLRASIEQRIALLQGLMDTDGSIVHTGQCTFTTTKPELRDGFAELIRSLGIKAVMCHRDPSVQSFPNGKSYACRENWQFAFTAPEEIEVFQLPRKLEIQKAKTFFHPRRTKRHAIVSVTPYDSVPVKCLTVDNESHLFLAGIAMIPTHNSAETETIALAPRAPFLAAEGQLEGYEMAWETANRRNHAFLYYKAIAPNGQTLPPPQRQAIEPATQAITQAAMLAADDLKATTGVYDAALGQQSPDVSGIAIQKRQTQTQISNFHFTDNLHRSMKHAGRILVDLIPKIYDTARTVRIINEDGSQKIVRINEKFHEDGKERIYSLDAGKYGVVVDTGPSYASKRQEAVEAMSEMTQAYPTLMQVAGDLMVKNMDWPGAQEISDRLKVMLPPQLQVDPKKQIPPMIQAQLQQMQGMIKQLTEHLNEATKVIETKKLDLEHRERVEFAKIQADIEINLAKLGTQSSIALLEQEVNAINQRMKLLNVNQPIEVPQDFNPQGADGGNYAGAGHIGSGPTGGPAPGTPMEPQTP